MRRSQARGTALGSVDPQEAGGSPKGRGLAGRARRQGQTRGCACTDRLALAEIEGRRRRDDTVAVRQSEVSSVRDWSPA